MSASSDWRDLPAAAPPPTISFYLRMRAERLELSARYNSGRRGASEPLWETTVERPPGKTLAECVEAALYRVARAGSDGLLVPPGWDSL